MRLPVFFARAHSRVRKEKGWNSANGANSN